MKRQRDYNYWVIDNFNEHFKTLKDAKYHCDIAFTPKERKMYLRRALICHIVGDSVVSYVEIRIDDNGAYSFSKVIKNK